MAITWTIKTSVAVPGLGTQSTDQTVTVTGDSETVFSKDVSAGQTVTLTFGSIDYTKINAFLMFTSGEGLTINTNAVDATGGDSFTLSAGKAIEWDNTQSIANLLTHNVTALYLINSGTKTASARVGFLSDV
jgi:hypothetical protein